MNTNNNHSTDTTHNAGFPPATPQASPSSSGGKAIKLGSSPSLAMARRLVADYYVTTVERVRFESVPADRAPSEWRVFLGDKHMDRVLIVKARSRFFFQLKGN